LGNTYYWKVTACNINGNTECRNVFSFIIEKEQTNLIVDVVEAENMNLNNYNVDNNGFASGGKVIKLAAGATGSAAYTFTGFTGERDIKIFYFDENDGAVTYKVYVNGNEVANWTANQNFGSADPNDATKTTETIEGVMLKNGDEVKIEAVQNSGEWGRIDKIEFIFETPEPTITSVEVESMTPVNFPTESQGMASGGMVRRIPAGQYGATGSAAYSFNLVPGAYDIKVWYIDEPDGVVPYKLYVNDQVVGTWSADADNPANTLLSRTIEDVPLKTGDIIKIEATQNAEEWGRSDRMDLILPWTEPVQSPPAEFGIIIPPDAFDLPMEFNLTWEAAKDAEYYRVVISKYKNFHKVDFETTVTGNSCLVTGLSHNTTYYVRITAVNELGSTEAANNDITFRTGKKIK
jgi:hypothetical protein